MIRTRTFARRGAAALVLASCAALLWAPAAQAQTSVTVNPNQGAPGSATGLQLSGFDQVPNCNAAAPTRQTCIYVDFIQGARTSTIAVATGSNASPTTVHVPPACAAPTNTNCSDAGPATIKATSPNGQTASTGFTVTSAAVTTTSSTSTSSSTTTTATSTSTTVAVTTTVSTVVLATTSTTAVPIKTKKSSSHSDVPRYIAVALVVLAAAATAGVDTRLRRLRG